MIELISIVVLTFALVLVVLGLTTIWLERGRNRLQGVVLIFIGLLTGVGYAFLGSRFSLSVFGRLLVRVDLPALMVTAFTYTAGVLVGLALAFGLFLWVTGRFGSRLERTLIVFALMGTLVALVATFIAVILST